jgi:hypothetical protein
MHPVYAAGRPAARTAPGKRVRPHTRKERGAQAPSESARRPTLKTLKTQVEVFYGGLAVIVILVGVAVGGLSRKPLVS